MNKVASIEVYLNEKTKENINFYITHDKSYGVKIEKGNEEINLPNISEEKGILTKLLGEMLYENNDITQLSYIIEDYMYNKKEQTV